MTKPRKPQDLEGIKTDVASFASSLGFASSLPNSGFNDTDFRKTGPIRKHQRIQKSSKNDREKTTEKPHERKQQRPKPKPGVSVLPLPAENSTIFGKFKNLPTLPLVKAGSLGVWYVDARELEERVIGKVRNLEVKSVEEWKRMVEKKRELGQRLIAQYTRDYEASKGQSGDIKMLMATQRSGTAADKVSAFAVLIGENPIANSRSLDALLAMVTSKVGKRHALIGFDTLKELFVSSLLPDRKLKSLLQQPVNHLPETKDGYSLLLFWYWEECLRQRYERFVNALDEASRDVLPALKDKAMKTMYVLLKSKAEQERKLLYFLVNKLGDPQSKSASSADFHLANLLSEHPNMKAVVIDEVDSFLFRPHLGIRAKYHAVNFLSQFRLTHKGDGPKVAKRLIDVYFVLFKVLISEADQAQNVDKKSKQKDNWRDSSSGKGSKAAGLSESHVELDSRLLSALLTGINRAFPYVSSSEADDIIEVQTPMLFKLVHSKNFNVGVQALMLLDKISSKNQVLSDRFYRALYSKLLLPAAMNSSKVEMFFGLLSRAMRNDINAKRVSAFSKRLLQVALQQPPEYACGCLFLLSEILKARPPLRNMMLQNESIDEDLEHFEDIIEEDNHPRTVSSNNSFHCSEDSSNGEDKGASTRTEDDISNEEGNPHGEDKFEKQEPIKNASATSFRFPGGYNPRHREPSFCNADCVGWWELTVLASHVHPSVATMARTLLSGAQIVYEGNPLNDLSLAAFLDKFMEKKPKPITWHGASQIEPANASKLELNHHLIGPEILSLAEVDVPPEDLVFHKFYTNKMNSSKKPKKKKKKKPTEDEIGGELFDVGGDESDNEEIEQMLDSDHPGFKADVDYNYDDLDQLNEEDADLVGDNSDAEMDALSDVAHGEDFDAMGDIDPTAEEASGSEDRDELKRTKRKLRGKTGLSPFASIEEYEHLLNEDNPREDSRSQRKKKKLKSGKTKK